MLRALVFLFSLLLAAGQQAHGAPLAGPNHDPVTLGSATLLTADGPRSVQLPHVLESGDFEPEGSRVRYRMVFTLAGLEEESGSGQPLGIYVPKMSLAGRLVLNGEEIGACELGPLEHLRCLHRPYLFVPQASSWRAGLNVLDVEIYANSRQMNGLAAVAVGPAQELAAERYRPMRFLKVNAVDGLAWVTLALGLIVLSVSIALRGDRLYSWFAATALAISLSNLNYTVSVPPVRHELFSWLIFATTQVTAPCLVLTVLSFFQRDWRWVRRALIAFIAIGPAAIWLSGNDRQVVALLYLPLMALGPLVAACALRWAALPQGRAGGLASLNRLAGWCMALSFSAVVVASLLDWLRLTGRSSFEGVYLVTYVIPSVAVVMGATLAGQLALALRTSRDATATLDRRVAQRTQELMQANRQLEALSATDGLTGLANRRHFEQLLDKEWLRARRDGVPLTLMMVDVDHFKRFNDTFGHLAGDECLRQVAQVIRARLMRSSDTTARYGGEEFIAITLADAERARELAEAIRQDIEAAILPFGPERAARLTASIGTATTVPDQSQSAQSLMQAADEALYAAKRGGRNRVVQAPG